VNPLELRRLRHLDGRKMALWQIQRRMPKAKFVDRFDIAAYYTSMRHDVIEAHVATTDLDAHQRKLVADDLALPDTQGDLGASSRQEREVGGLRSRFASNG